MLHNYTKIQQDDTILEILNFTDCILVIGLADIPDQVNSTIYSGIKYFMPELMSTSLLHIGKSWQSNKGRPKSVEKHLVVQLI